MSLLTTSSGIAPERIPVSGPTFTFYDGATGEVSAVDPSGSEYLAPTEEPRRSTPLPPAGLTVIEEKGQSGFKAEMAEPEASNPDPVPLPEEIERGVEKPDPEDFVVFGYEVDRTYAMIGGAVGLALALYLLRAK